MCSLKEDNGETKKRKNCKSYSEEKIDSKSRFGFVFLVFFLNYQVFVSIFVAFVLNKSFLFFPFLYWRKLLKLQLSLTPMKTQILRI